MLGRNMKSLARLAVIGVLALVGSPALSQTDDVLGFAPRAAPPPGYPESYRALVRAAEDEGRLVIYSTTDADVAAPLIADFRAMYPRIEVVYEDLSSTELYHRFIAETKLGADTADILWSSAMDQQAALVSDGYAMTYLSPEKAHLPAWANWKDQAFATTYEPVVFAYNKKLLQPNEVPQTHAAFIRLLDSDPTRFKGKVSGYNIEKSGLGFFLATQDATISQEFWTLARALGKAQPRFELTTGAMTRRLSSGETLLGYNLLGAYTAQQAAANPDLGYVYPRDYTLVMSRILIASSEADHPNAAKLWIDYLLSKRGQTALANAARLPAVRDDVEGENTAARLKQTLGASERPIAIGPALIGYLNNQNYRDFILQWRKALSGS
jgi:iron(III) transport system substrate-binding protein